jgi:coenzyme Q-binding protein COQ10
MPPRLLLRAAPPRLPLTRPIRRLAPTISSRPFITLPGSSPSPQTLTASRTLPYAPKALYEIISNIDSYSTFVPFCSASKVTHWSEPSTTDNHNRRSPTQATLRVGWAGFEESFTSRVNCVPFSLVEAVSGASAQLVADPGRKLASNNSSVLRTLVTRWSLTPRTVAGKEGAEVNLTIRFEFANPIYAAFSAAVSETIAARMIEAFESHARSVLDKNVRPRVPL